MVLIILILIWIASFFYCVNISDDKGYGHPLWCLFGFFLGPLSVIPVAGLPDKKLRYLILQIREEYNSINNEDKVQNIK